MIQGALELEVEECVQRARYDKTEAENFRGYRNGYHQQREEATAVGAPGGESSASIG